MSNFVTGKRTHHTRVGGVDHSETWTSPVGDVLASNDGMRAAHATVLRSGATATLIGSPEAVSWVPRRGLNDWSLELDGAPVAVTLSAGGPLRQAVFDLSCAGRRWSVSSGALRPRGQWLLREGDDTPIATSGSVFSGWLRFHQDIDDAEAALAVLLRTRLMAATTRLYFLNRLA